MIGDIGARDVVTAFTEAGFWSAGMLLMPASQPAGRRSFCTALKKGTGTKRFRQFQRDTRAGNEKVILSSNPFSWRTGRIRARLPWVASTRPEPRRSVGHVGIACALDGNIAASTAPISSPKASSSNSVSRKCHFPQPLRVQRQRYKQCPDQRHEGRAADRPK